MESNDGTLSFGQKSILFGEGLTHHDVAELRALLLDSLEKFINGGYQAYKIKEDLNSGIDYSRFWLNLLPSKQSFDSSLLAPLEEDKVVRASGMKKSGYGEWDNFTELDGIHYSFSVLKAQDMDEMTRAVVDVLSQISAKYEDNVNEDKRKRFIAKKLRIKFYESLYSRNFLLYNVDLYNKVATGMIENLKRVERLIEEHERPIILKSLDSVGFIAKSREDAERIMQDINENVTYKMHLKYFTRMIHFINYLWFKNESGEEFFKLTTYNPSIEQFEKIKEEIGRLLLEKKYNEALLKAKSTPDAPDPKGNMKADRFRRSYVGLLLKAFPNLEEKV